MRVTKKPPLKNKRLIAENRKKNKTDTKSGRTLLGNRKTQRGGFLESMLAALAPTAINGLTKILGEGRKKRRVKRVAIKRAKQLSKKR